MTGSELQTLYNALFKEEFDALTHFYWENFEEAKNRAWERFAERVNEASHAKSTEQRFCPNVGCQVVGPHKHKIEGPVEDRHAK